MATFDVSIKPNHVEVQNALAQVKKKLLIASISKERAQR